MESSIQKPRDLRGLHSPRFPFPAIFDHAPHHRRPHRGSKRGESISLSTSSSRPPAKRSSAKCGGNPNRFLAHREAASALRMRTQRDTPTKEKRKNNRKGRMGARTRRVRRRGRQRRPRLDGEIGTESHRDL